MGKIRTRVLGMEDVEEQQKKEQKERAAQKKAEKKKDSKALEALKEVEAKEKIETTEGGEESPESAKGKKEAEQKLTSSEGIKKHVRGKKYKTAKKGVHEDKFYLLSETIPVLKKVKYANFDESVELHLNVDEQGLKGEVELPHSTGKTIRVKIVDDATLEKIEQGVIDFDVLVAHPSFMPKLAKFARVLGPKGLMPNPKAGTVSPNPEEVVKKFEKGVLRWKTEPKFPLIHQLIGKISFDEKMLVENAESFIRAVGKPHIKAVFIKTTMSPSLKVDIEKI
jgi:large subunit ribosomal protein L1